jgi:hypothetical protein
MMSLKTSSMFGMAVDMDRSQAFSSRLRRSAMKRDVAVFKHSMTDDWNCLCEPRDRV